MQPGPQVTGASDRGQDGRNGEVLVSIGGGAVGAAPSGGRPSSAAALTSVGWPRHPGGSSWATIWRKTNFGASRLQGRRRGHRWNGHAPIFPNVSRPAASPSARPATTRSWRLLSLSAPSRGGALCGRCRNRAKPARRNSLAERGLLSLVPEKELSARIAWLPPSMQTVERQARRLCKVALPNLDLDGAAKTATILQ